jgi:hypothetical protein
VRRHDIVLRPHWLYFTYVVQPGTSAPRAARRRLLRLCRATGCLGTSRDSLSTSSPTSRVRIPRHVARLVTRLVAPLVVNYFAYAARPGASARRAARYVARRRLLRLCRVSGCLGTSRGSSRRSSSTTSPTSCVRVPQHVVRLVVDFFAYVAHPGASARRGSLSTTSPPAGSSSTTSPTPRVRVPWHIARLVTRLVTPLVIDYFTYAACPGALARRAARHVARRRLLRLCRASGCLSTSRGQSRCSSSTSPTPRVRVPRHVAWLVAPLVVYSFAYAVCPGASTRRAARCRLLRQRRASGCLSTSRGSSSTTSPRAGSSSTTSPTPRVWVAGHVAWLVTRLVALLIVDYFAYASRPGASARRAARHVSRRRLLRLCRASGCLGMSHGSSRRSSSTSPTPRVWVPRHVVRLVMRLVVDCSMRHCSHTGSTSATPCVATTCLVATLALLRVRRAPL